MLAQYHCFARRVKSYSEKSQTVVTALLLCMGLFCGFVFGAALTRLPFPGMIARFPIR